MSLNLILGGCKKEKQANPGDEETVVLPKLVTAEPVDLTHFSVTLGGSVTDRGKSAISEAGIVVGLEPNPTLAKNFNVFKVTLTENNQFKILIGYMPPSTTFYIRTFATNDAGTGYGNEIKFTSLIGNETLEHFKVTTQQEVIALGAKKFTSVQSLEISGSVTDLSPLNTIHYVTGEMKIIGTTNLTGLKGLENLEIVGSNFPNGLTISSNIALNSLEGLNKLRTVRGDFYIIDNPLFVNLAGLENYLATPLGQFRVDLCANLRSLDGIERMEVASELAIMNNPVLNDLKGLRNVKSVIEILVVNNSSLTNLDGLEGVTDLSRRGIRIQDNQALNSLKGLRNLKTCGSLWVITNASLPDLNGLEQLNSMEYLELINNDKMEVLSGLDNLKVLEFKAKISENEMLGSLLGLGSLAKMGSLEIVLNKSLKSLSGLGVKEITGGNGSAITIGHNENLTSLNGLGQLVKSTDGIQINYNKNLTDFCGLSALFGTYNGTFLAIENKVVMDRQILLATCK